MKDLTKFLAVVGAVIAIKKMIESRRACLYAGPIKICNG
jgi:hypothetical protein